MHAMERMWMDQERTRVNGSKKCKHIMKEQAASPN